MFTDYFSREVRRMSAVDDPYRPSGSFISMKQLVDFFRKSLFVPVAQPIVFKWVQFGLVSKPIEGITEGRKSPRGTRLYFSEDMVKQLFVCQLTYNVLASFAKGPSVAGMKNIDKLAIVVRLKEIYDLDVCGQISREPEYRDIIVRRTIENHYKNASPRLVDFCLVLYSIYFFLRQWSEEYTVASRDFAAMISSWRWVLQTYTLYNDVDNIMEGKTGSPVPLHLKETLEHAIRKYTVSNRQALCAREIDEFSKEMRGFVEWCYDLKKVNEHLRSDVDILLSMGYVLSGGHEESELIENELKIVLQVLLQEADCPFIPVSLLPVAWYWFS